MASFLLFSLQIWNVIESLSYGTFQYHYAIKIFFLYSYDISWDIFMHVMIRTTMSYDIVIQ